MNAPAAKPAARAGEPPVPEIDSFRGQHLDLAERKIATELGRANVTVDHSESPLAWLARRRGRNGRPLIEPHQLQARERLRADFTRAHMMPRTTSNWASPIASGRRGAGGERAAAFTETILAARQRVHHALDAAGPEFGELLLDVCYFLKKSRRYRTRTRLAFALGQGRAATRARPAGAPLRLCDAGEGTGACGNTNVAGGRGGVQCRLGRDCRPLTGPKPRRPIRPPNAASPIVRLRRAHCLPRSRRSRIAVTGKAGRVRRISSPRRCGV